MATDAAVDSNARTGNAVEIRDLCFRYASDAFELRIPELSFESSRPAALIGPSGCGKTTLLHLISGILTAESGTLEVAGRRLERLSDSERRAFRISTVGLVFQEFELLEHLSVRENILLPYFVNHALSFDTSVRDHLVRVTERVGIARLLGRRPRELSQGERQRVAICRALITSPDLLLADEPTGNLDPETSKEVLELLLEETAAQEATAIMVTHDHGLLGQFERVVDLADFAERKAI